MEKIKEILSKAKGIPELSPEMIEKLVTLSEILVRENKKVNVTAITDSVGIAEKHFLDSLSILTLDEMKKEGLKMADIGCGGGFPGLPVKIARPDLDLVMIDSTDKKIRYVDATARELGLEKIHPTTARAEEIAGEGGALREKFDLVTARAVARLNVLAELCLPFVKVGGVFISMKAMSAEEELSEAKRAIGQLGGRVKYIKELTFDLSRVDKTLFTDEENEKSDEFVSSKRYAIVIEKVSKTPSSFPRAWAKMTKKPL